ncbi:MAG: S41 family peptidase [Aggregatilineales bacterium]
MTPQNYVEYAIELMEQHAYYQPKIENWQTITKQALQDAATIETLPDTYPILRHLLKSLDDNHSHLYLPDKATTGEKTTKPSGIPTGHRIEQWGYLSLPRAVGNDAEMLHYAEVGQALLRDMPDVPGWVLDLRECRGGNMWAMLSAAGAMIGDGVYGAFIDRNGDRTQWGYQHGVSMYYATDDIDPEIIYQVNNPVASSPQAMPLAVLCSERTGSSGEIMLISCIGRSNMCSFGQHTRGVSTANSTYPMPDGAVLVITTGVCADRHGNIYEYGITPDVVSEEPLEDALNWLRTF